MWIYVHIIACSLISIHEYTEWVYSFLGKVELCTKLGII
jgi:hypothetical protein